MYTEFVNILPPSVVLWQVSSCENDFLTMFEYWIARFSESNAVYSV